MITGFKTALEIGAEIIVKMDGDGQMEARHLAAAHRPAGRAQSRLRQGQSLLRSACSARQVPHVRRFGNFGLTLLSKAASGFWHLSDPTNGYFALRANALRLLNFHLLAPRYFFEISLLIQLNVIRAVAVDVPIPAKYADENSSLSPWRALCTFPAKLAGGLASIASGGAILSTISIS